ncbi:hypothetical protein MWU58_07105 [Flavobacteriaceae bacterium S0825]|uniref:hypothetical protein n=1 Tax=Gaetbulibacter sp. S0825 TaxID=2720084 RepID=UPI00142FF5AD|nr:hypothetical protein [Gaetbulibacter sp. S0825]MCK0109055.1 hypothetical protein [Flavobacteriaceae bacterium S0825]NIX64690.1 hypothetical protein [Gaetbulibacter sp. S0825]
MKFSLNNIRTAFNKNNASNESQDAEYLEKLMAPIEDKPFAVSNNNIMFAGMNELAGYYYFRAVIVGKFKVKTFKGAEIIIKCKNFEMTLKSNMDELNSDFGEVPNSFITAIDFDIEKKQIEKLNKSKIQSLRVISKRQDVTFKTAESES